jgi:hypothetical protein
MYLPSRNNALRENTPGRNPFVRDGFIENKVAGRFFIFFLHFVLPRSASSAEVVQAASGLVVQSAPALNSSRESRACPAFRLRLQRSREDSSASLPHGRDETRAYDDLNSVHALSMDRLAGIRAAYKAQCWQAAGVRVLIFHISKVATCMMTENWNEQCEWW